jgi:hypothetical protein
MTPSQFHRTNISLHSSDVEYLKSTFGHGWTTHLRDIIHQEVRAIQSRIAPTFRKPPNAAK